MFLSQLTSNAYKTSGNCPEPKAILDVKLWGILFEKENGFIKHWWEDFAIEKLFL